MYDTDSELYNEFLDKYFDEYYYLPDAKKEELACKFMLNSLKGLQVYDQWYKERLVDDFDEEFIDASDMPTREDKEEVK